MTENTNLHKHADSILELQCRTRKQPQFSFRKYDDVTIDEVGLTTLDVEAARQTSPNRVTPIEVDGDGLLVCTCVT